MQLAVLTHFCWRVDDNLMLSNRLFFLFQRYEVAGGLHGFTAKAELHAEVPTNPYFRTIECQVYCKLSDEQALRLALRHNINGHFIHKMTFRDIVSKWYEWDFGHTPSWD